MAELILDAYNVICRIPSLRDKHRANLEKGRKELLLHMSEWTRTSGFKGRIILVFDGQDGIAGGLGVRAPGIDAVFTKTGEKADDRIISIVHASSNKASITVVSDDIEVKDACRKMGAAVKPVSYLEAGPKTGSNKPRVSVGFDKKKVDNYTEYLINEELKKEWGIG